MTRNVLLVGVVCVWASAAHAIEIAKDGQATCVIVTADDAPATDRNAAKELAGHLNAVTGGTYTAYLRRQADSAYARDRNTIDAYGNQWAGPFVTTNHACQGSALDLLNATP